MNVQRIYLDFNGSTPIAPEVAEVSPTTMPSKELSLLCTKRGAISSRPRSSIRLCSIRAASLKSSGRQQRMFLWTDTGELILRASKKL